jgi:thiol-disulfide isomerase/thioredoxin
MKAKILKIVLLIIFLIGQIQLRSQSKSYPVPGEPIPEFTLTDVHDYAKKTFLPGDAKGKWLILDFWNKSCVSCIASFPKINRLQNEFKEQVQFLLIGRNISEERDVAQIYDRFKKRFNLQLSVAYDSVLIKQFGVNQYPFIIIIDPQSTVYAITSGSELTKETLRDLVDKMNPVFNRVYGRFEEPDHSYYARWNYLLELKYAIVKNTEIPRDFLYRSVFSKSSERDRFGALNIDADVERGFYQVTHVTLFQLYNIAWWGESDWDRWIPEYNRWTLPVLEVRDSSLFRFSYEDRIGLYNYSLIIPKEKSTKQYLMEVMQRDLKNYFGYEVSEETRVLPYWRLTATEEARRKLRSKSDVSSDENGPTGFKIKKVRIGYVLGVIQTFHDFNIPAIDETNIKEPIDISVDALMTDLDDVIKALRKQGLILEKSEKEFKVLVIRDPKP